MAALARDLAGLLCGAGVGHGEVIGLAAPNGPGFLAGVVALRAAGHPVLLIDAVTPDPERRRILAHLGVGALLATDEPWPTKATEFCLVEWATGRPIEKPMDNVAIVKLSSGSSGEFRGVAASADALIADDRGLVRSMGIRDDDVFLASVPFSHSYGFSSLVLPALLRGAPLVVPDDTGPLSPLDAAAEEGATVFPSVPTYLAGLARASAVERLPEGLRLVISAGAPLRETTARRFRDRFGKAIHVFYGASECGGISFDREGSAGERGTVGAPLDGVTVSLESRGAGGRRSGQVVVRSGAVAEGYLRCADDRLRDGGFRTDDLGRWVDGDLQLLGRVGELINVHGRKVHPKEVEGVIAQLAGVEDVAVTAGGDGSRAWVEAVVACSTGELSVPEVLAWCRRQLAPFKVPRRVVLVPDLPRNQRGKIRRLDLARLLGGAFEERVTDPMSST